MCFSAVGSFALSGVLVGTGATAMTRNGSPSHRLFAAIPLVFAAQQAAEGVVWLTIADPAQATLQRLSVAVFLGIAVVIWPTWCPLSLCLAERNPARRRALLVMSWIGGGVSLCGLALLLRWHPAAMVAGHRIEYVHEASTLGRYTLLVYAVAAVLPFFVSTTTLVRTIGTTFVVALVVTIVIYREALTSVWCFFAAILSGLILVAVIKGQRDVSSPVAGTAGKAETAARSLLLGVSLLVTLGALAASAQVRKPVPGQPYQYWDVEDIDGGARRVYFRNDSPNPITITQLVIQRCDNTRQACGTYPANVVVAPGKTVMPFKIERLDKKLGWQFSYSFHTAGQPAVTTAPSPQSLTMGGPGGGAPIALKTTMIDSLLPSVAAFTDGGSCGKVRVSDLPPGHRALLMVFGTATQPTARRVMVRLDGNGSPYDFVDIRQDPNDTTSTPHRTQITIDFVRQSVVLVNSGDGQPTAAFRATGATLLTAASLGTPGETIARMVKECVDN